MTILSMLEFDSFASSNALSTEGLHRSTIGLINSSSFALVILNSKFLAPDDGSCAINGKLTSVSITVDNSIFAFSEASLILVIAVES